jgi:hypothetical protein
MLENAMFYKIFIRNNKQDNGSTTISISNFLDNLYNVSLLQINFVTLQLILKYFFYDINAKYIK